MRPRRQLEAADEPVRHERPAGRPDEVAAHLEVPLPLEVGMVLVRGEAREPRLQGHAHGARRHAHAARLASAAMATRTEKGKPSGATSETTALS